MNSNIKGDFEIYISAPLTNNSLAIAQLVLRSNILLWQHLLRKNNRLNYIYSLFHKQWISNNHYTVLEIQFRSVKYTAAT